MIARQDPLADLFAEASSRREGLDSALDAIRARFGEKALVHGRTLAPKPRAKPSTRAS